MTRYIKALIRAHALAGACAFIVGVLAVLPYLLGPVMLGSEYAGIPYLYQDSEDLYISRLQEISDGNYFIRSPHQHEYKVNEHALMMPYGEWLYGWPIFFGASPAWVVLCMRFLIPALLVLLAYALVLHILRSIDVKTRESLAVLAGVLFVQGVEYIHPHFILAMMQQDVQTQILNIWTRITNPGIGGVLLLLSLVLIERLRDRVAVITVLALGVVIALQIGYIFAFVFTGAVLGAHALIALIRREYPLAIALVSAGTIALAANAHYLYTTLFSVAVDAADHATRNGLLHTHEPMINKLVFVVGVITLLVYAALSYRKRVLVVDRVLVWVLAFVVGALVAFNLQVVVGSAVWPQHFVQYSIPLSLVACVLLVCRVWQEFGKPKWLMYASYIGVVVSMCITAQSLYSVSAVFPDFRARQTAAPVIAFFKTVERPCVVLVSEGPQFLNRMIPAHTPCDTYMTSYIYAAPRERIVHDYYIRMLLDGVTPKTVDAYMQEHHDDVREYLSSNWGQLFYHQSDAWLKRVYPTAQAEAELQLIKDALIAGFPTAYDVGLNEMIKRYRVDYFVVDTRLRSLPKDLERTVAYVADKGPYRIYRVK